MRGNEFLDKMELIDPIYVEAAEDKPKKKKNVWMKWGAMAACLCIAIIGTMLWRQFTPARGETSGITVSEKGVTIPQMHISLSPNEAADMLGFFIYEGRCYMQYERIYEDVDIVGTYLGTANGLIDEWTSKDGYVDFAGSVSGDFYTVKGYDPAFMLCIKEENGAIATYICNNGITLKYGSELYADRLHLSDNFASVQYETRDSWFYSKGECYPMTDAEDVLLDFIAEMNSAQFIPSDSIPLDEGQTTVSDTELYHLYFQMQDGTTVHLRLHENGYVCFDGMLEICVQVPEKSYSALLQLLDGHTDSAK